MSLPYEIGRGKITFAGLELEVVTLNTGQAVITEESMEAFCNWLLAGNTIDAEDIEEPQKEGDR